MTISYLEFSIVVVANDHNPTIINPDFLERQGIVAETWGWKVLGPAITIPPFATVSYDSRVTVSVEPNRLKLTDTAGTGGPQSSKLVEIVQKYVKVLPHVRYSAVGINFRSLVEHSEAQVFLKDRFLKAGPWDSKDHSLQAVGIKLVYPLEGGRLTLSLDPGTVTQRLEGASNQMSGVLTDANFHRDCQGYPSADQVMEHLGNAKKDWSNYQSLLSEILPG